jgi:hypothetical protein
LQGLVKRNIRSGIIMNNLTQVTVVNESTLEVIFYCNTIKEAEAFIAGIEYKSPEEVRAGLYGIDAPEHLLK